MIDPFKHKYCENFDEEKSDCRIDLNEVDPVADCCNNYSLDEKFTNLSLIEND